MIRILEIIVPVFLLIFAGYVLKRKNVITEQDSATLKNVAVNLFLPPLAFNVLIHGDFSKNALVMMALGIVILFLAYIAGLLLKPLFDKNISGYVPLSVTTFEGGMFGWAMIAILVGENNLFYIVPMDIMNGIFCFSFMAASLKMLSGDKLTGKQIAKSICTNPLIIAVVLGFVGCAFKLGKIIDSSPYAALYAKCILWFTSPLTPVILLTIGAGLVLDAKVLSKGIRLVACRFVVMAVLCTLTLLVLPFFITLTPVLRLSLITYFFVPPSFILPMYTKSKESIEFTSGFLSLQIIVSLIIYTAIVLFASPLLAV